MGVWNANWDLDLVNGQGYGRLKVGRFTLKSVTNQPGRFVVHTTPNAPKAKWLGVPFERKGSVKGPNLGWPLLRSPEASHCREAAKWMRSQVEQRWGNSLVPQFEYLEATIPWPTGPEKIALFKANNAFVGGTDFLIGILIMHLSGRVSPDGSVIGRRR